MANDFALGKTLEIPPSVLKDIDNVDKKITNISTNAEKMANAFKSAFSSIGNNADTFISKLDKIRKVVSNLGDSRVFDNLNKGFGNTASQAEKVVNSVTRVATTMNKLASSGNSGFNPNSSVLAWQGLQKNIEQVQQKQEQLLKVTREYERELSRINSGKGGVISKNQTESYQNTLKEIEANKQLIASYREKQQAIIAYQAQQRQELQNLQALKNYESQRTSLPEQRSANELKKLNDYYRELEKSSAKAAEAQEKAAQRQQQAQERAAAAAERAAQRQQAAQEKAAQQQDTRTNNKALDAYNRAMAASEALVTQRINKIAKLRQAEEMLTATGRNYTEQLKRIQSEISRLNKLNEGQIRANGQIVRSQHNLMDISGQLQRRLALVFSVSQISSYLVKLRDVTGEFELQNTALASILKNQNQADVLFQQITDLAVRSPFTVKELTTYTKSLSAYGFEYEKLYDTTKRLADVAAGLGVDMERIILAYGQVSAANVLRGCLGYATPVMLYDGTIKQVQDVIVGDVLINEKGEPVNVLELIRGMEMMYVVEQVSGENRTSYRVNRNHILTLWNVQEQRLEDVYVYDYLKNTEAYLGLKIVDGEKVYYDIEVTKDRVDNYYGFVLDGNKRFRLGDGTITHNTETRQFSEAGLNILKELADYYSEVEGRAVSLGEVQDRQFKKMISFQDVEEVFKRITSEGGTFYKMQERQAETIAGQVSNLQDSIDIMLNSIGQANRETITTMLSAIKSLVEHWQIFADMIKGVSAFMAIYTIRTLAAAAANGKFSASALAATASAGGLRGALATMMQVLQSIFNFAKNNPFILILSAVVTLGSGLYTHIQNVKEAKKQYDLLTKSLNDNKDEFNKILTTIQNQNKAIENANKAVKNAGNNTAEYAEAQEKLRLETEEQTTNIEKLKSKFPQIAASIKQNADGTYDLAEATKAYNEAMEGVERITYFAKNTKTFWNDGLKQNITDATEAQGEYNQAERDGANALKDLKIASNDFFNSAIGKHYPELQKEINNILNSSDTVYDKFDKIRTLLNNKPIVRGAIWNSDISDAFYNLDTALTDTKGNYDDLADNIEDISEKIRKEYDLNTEEGKKKAKEYTEEFIRQLNIQNDEVRKFVEQEFTIHIGVQIDTQNISSGATLGNIPLFSNVERRINDYLKKNKFNLLGEIKPETGREQYSADIKKKYEDAVKELEELKVATEERYDNISNENRKKYLETYVSQAKQYLKDWEGYVEKSDKKRSSSTMKNPELDRLREMISLIQKAQDEYEKLRDYESENVSVNKVKDAFKGTSVSSILSGLNSFDTQNIINALEQLRSIATKAGKDGRKALEEAMRPLEIQLRIDLREEQLNNIKEELDRTFEDYDLSKDLLGTGFDANLIKTVFNIPITSLDDLEKKLQEIKPQLVGQGKEYEDAWDEAMKKVTELQEKELLERTKKYAEYLKKSVTERVRIELEAQKEIAEVQANPKFNDTQKRIISDRIRTDANKKLDEQAWKDFQNSDLYIRMFEDLDTVSSKTLDMMRQKLVSLRESLHNLDPENLKTINEQIEKINEQDISRNPFKGLIPNIKEYIKYRKQAGDLEERYRQSAQNVDNLTTSVEQQQLIVAAQEREYNASVAQNGELDARSQLLKDQLNISRKQLDQTLDELVAEKEITQELADQIRNGDNLGKSLQDRFSQASQMFSSMSQSVSELQSGLESMFGTFGDGADIAFSTMSEILNGLSTMASGAADISSGNPFQMVSGGVQVISGLASTIGSLFNIKDKKKEKEIKRQLELVEDLEKAYEKLGETIDEAYSLDTLSAATNMSRENLEQQKEALEKALAAEESKKNVDKDRVKEFEEQIDEVNEKLEELNKDVFSKATGGIFDDVLSVATSFTDAWLDSFLEVGDGLDSLTNSFKDAVRDMLVQQASMLITQKFIEKWKKGLEKYIDPEKDDLELTTEEAKNWVDEVTSTLPAMNDALKNYFEALQNAGINLNGTNDDKLSELQKGIQGITEETAQALEALLESMRFYVANSYERLVLLVDSITATDSGANPMLAELQTQTILIRSMESMLSSVIKISGSKGRVLRVEIA